MTGHIRRAPAQIRSSGYDFEVFIDRFRYNANRAAQVQSKLKLLEKLPELKPLVKEAEVILRFPDNFEKLSPPILQLDEVEFGYSPDQRLFSDLSVSADLESRICINHNFTLDPELELKIEERGSQLIDISPIDTALQTLSHLPLLTNSPVVQAWTAADTALCLSTALGYSLTLGLAFILFKRVHEMRESMTKNPVVLPLSFKRNPRKRDTRAETTPTFIEMDSPPAEPKAENN